MDKFNFIRDGGSRLPPGLKFQPTDEEIVFLYLARKIFSYPLPASVIPEMNIFSFYDPWELPGNLDQDRYFFANRELNHWNVNRSSRGSCVGFWKFTGSDKRICSKRMPIVGIKKTLVFYKGKHPFATRTDWFMHVYCIAISGNTACNMFQQKKHFQGSLIQIGKWTLCHIFLKKRITKAEVYDNGWQQNYDHFMTADITDTDSSSASSSSDSDSSVLSEVSSSSTADSETNTS